MIPGKKYAPEDLLLLAWRSKWLVVVPLILGGLGASVWAHYQPNMFLSETLILVVPQRVPENYVRSTVTTRLQDRLQSMNAQILSRTRLERIIQDLNLYPELRRVAFMEEVVDQMRKAITVLPVKGDAFRISYASERPVQAQKVTERLASLFIDESLKDREVLAEGTNQFLETQLQDARQRLIEHEKKLEQYNRQHAGELPTQMSSNLQAMNGAQMQLQTLADSINRDRDRRLNLERMLADLTALSPQSSDNDVPADGTTPTPKRNRAAAPIVTNPQLDAARRQLHELELRLKPAHPDITRARKALDELEQKAASDAAALEEAILTGAPEPPRGPAPNTNDPIQRARTVREEMATLDKQIVTKEAEEARLHGVIADYQRRVEAIPGRESELTELTRDYATIRGMYTSLLGKNEEAKISANLERRQIGEQFKVVDPAQLPQQPFSPDRLKIGAFGAVAGFVLGLALAAFLEYRDTTLKTDDDVLVALALPVLALVPVMRSADERRQQRRRRLILSLTSAATVLASLAIIFVVWRLKIRSGI